MRRSLSILFLSFTLLIFGSETALDEEVWIDGTSFYKSITHSKRSTIYFKEWSAYIDQFLKDESYFVALQLNRSFDPLPKDHIRLPSLLTLAAIGDADVRVEYYTFLKNFGRTHGINYMILPDSTGLDDYQKKVLAEMNENSPFYFLSSDVISFNVPSTKKEYLSKSDDQPIIWVANQDLSTKKIKKWGRKLNNRQGAFYESLKSAKSAKYISTYELTESLRRSLFSASLVAIDPHHQFPIKSSKISYLGSDELLKNRLSQYAQVVPYRIDDTPTIVDNRNQDQLILAGDIVIQGSDDPITSAALILSEVSILNEDIVLSQALFGAREINGRSNHPFSRQVSNENVLGYSSPEWEGMSIARLSWIDSLAKNAIQKHATPGIQLAVVKNGSVVLTKTYGHYTYDSLREVSGNTRYDIASLTKVIATLPAVALLVDRGEINLDDSISMHLKSFSNSNKSHVTIRQLLAHNAGVLSYVPFWSMMMTGDRLDAFYYKTPEDEAKDIRTYGLEPHPNMLDSLKSYIVRSRLIKNPGKYHYSDLGFMILHLLVEEVSGMRFDEFVTANFYRPMELLNTMFNPQNQGLTFEDIAPTEFDYRYRNSQVWGEVHDRNALVFGGVAGHAGLFSNAIDLAKMMMMFMNKGIYGGKRYLSEATVELFNARYFENNRRGLGWDKKDGKKAPSSNYASDQSFGHTGFTGTMVWADPEKELVFVFLSNRIYPNADNWKLSELKTRTQMHDIIYQSLRENR